MLGPPAPSKFSYESFWRFFRDLRLFSLPPVTRTLLKQCSPSFAPFVCLTSCPPGPLVAEASLARLPTFPDGSLLTPILNGSLLSEAHLVSCTGLAFSTFGISHV